MANLKPARPVSTADMAACNKVADQAVNDPERRQQQNGTLVGATSSGFAGVFIVSMIQSANDSAVNDAAVNQCLARRGYKMKAAS